MPIIMENTLILILNFSIIPWIYWSSTWMPNFSTYVLDNTPFLIIIRWLLNDNNNIIIELAVRELYTYYSVMQGLFGESLSESLYSCC